ncbi:ABC transporter substrate-binding protein [Streptomyces sp. NPDC005438]|uniref:ABC transporter substrate-binding protein n=1 Tax=Streptomyces sp. NPDC005438 TaxID=3156880 RepID=UPI0033A3CFB1
MPPKSSTSTTATPFTRRRLLAAGGALGLTSALAACGDSGSGGSGGSWVFTDDRDKKARVDGTPRRVVAYVGVAAALHDYGVADRVVGVFGPTKAKNGKPDVLAGDLDVDKVQILGNTYGQFNVERYAKLRPELLVTHMFLPGDLWYVPAESRKKILKLAPSVGIKTADTSMLTTIKRYASLADKLGADLRSTEVKRAKARFQKAADHLTKVTGGKSVRVLAGAGSQDLFYVSDPNANADLRYFKQLGVDFVQPRKVSEQGFYEELSWENADRYDADLILLDNRTQWLQPDALKSKPTWRDLPAVKAGQITPWMAEPIYSYASAAPLLEKLAKAIGDAKKIT